MKGERKLVNILLGGDPLHKLVKLGTLVIPTFLAAICDLTLKSSYVFPTFVVGFLAMSAMIYHNIHRAREPS